MICWEKKNNCFKRVLKRNEIIKKIPSLMIVSVKLKIKCMKLSVTVVKGIVK